MLTEMPCHRNDNLRVKALGRIGIPIIQQHDPVKGHVVVDSGYLFFSAPTTSLDLLLLDYFLLIALLTLYTGLIGTCMLVLIFHTSLLFLFIRPGVY